MTKKIAVGLVSLSMLASLALPFGAQALTAEELLAQIQQLQQQLNQLMQQYQQMTGSSAGTCNFTRNLYVGLSGDDVKCLQNYLISGGYSIPAGATGYFGSQTKAAVAAWQAANGVSPAAGYFGPVSQAKYKALTSGTGVGTGGGTTGCPAATEGSFTVTLAASPANSTVDAGNDIGLYGIDVTAFGSDITIGRVDLQVSVAQGATTYAPHTLIKNIYAYDGSTKLTEMKDVTFSQDSNLVYFLQIPGINFKVPKGTTKTLTFKMDTSTSLDNNRTVTVQVYGNNGIRGTDCAGLNTFAALATTRTHTIQVPGQATLTIALDSDSPRTDNHYSPATGNIKIPLMKFTASATGGSAKLRKLAVDITSNTASRILATTLYLKDGDTVIQSVTGDNKDFPTFENFSYTIPVNTSKTLTIEGEYLPIDSTSNTNPTNNNVARISIPATSDNCQFERGDTTLQQCTVSAQINSKNQYLFRQGVKFALVSATSSVVNNGAADNDTYIGVIKFTATPFNGTMTKLRFATLSATAVSATTTATISARDASNNLINIASQGVPTIVTSPDEDTQAGSTATITITSTITDTSSSATGQVRTKLDFISWTVGNVSADQGTTDPTAADDLFGTWVTPYANLP